jgi:hypothetical protein
MARPWRIEYEGVLYHVFSRGNNQQDIFVTDDDRYVFLDTLGQMSERFDTDIFAYVLMSNPPRIHLWIKKVCQTNHGKKANIQIYRLGPYWV